jgi:hypothetical protein
VFYTPGDTPGERIEWLLSQTAIAIEQHPAIWFPVLAAPRERFAGQRRFARTFLRWNLVDRMDSPADARRSGLLTPEQERVAEERLEAFARLVPRLEEYGLRLPTRLREALAGRD